MNQSQHIKLINYIEGIKNNNRLCFDLETATFIIKYRIHIFENSNTFSILAFKF